MFYHTVTNRLQLLFVLLIGMLVCAAGCHSRQQDGNPAQSPRIHLYTSLDTSISCREHLGDYAAECARLASRLNPEDWLSLFRTDCLLLEVYDNPAPESSESFSGLLQQELQPLPAHPGTFPSLFFSDVVRRITPPPSQKKSEHEKIVIIWFGDGDDDQDNSKSSPLLKAAARALAINPDVSAVFFVGVNNANRAHIRACFNELGDKLHLLGPEEKGSEQLQDLIEQSRDQKGGAK